MPFKASITPQQAKAVLDKINNKIEAALPRMLRLAAERIRNIKEVEQFIEFLKTDQFAADFGVPADVQQEIAAEFESLFSGQQADVVRKGNEFSFAFIPEEELRFATETVWDNSLGLNLILVNAWDIYEYGVIGRSQNRSAALKGLLKNWLLPYKKKI